MRRKPESTVDIVPFPVPENDGDAGAALLRLAVERGADLSTLERLVDLKERLDARRREAELTAALTRFHAAVPQITKRTKVSFVTRTGQRVSYSYAELDEIDRVIRPHLVREGLSYRWDCSARSEREIAVTCYVEHVAGGSRTASFSIPVEARAGMSAPQNLAAALTYARRQTLIMALGLSTTDQDIDARVVEEEEEAVEEAAEEAFGDLPREESKADVHVGRACPRCGGPVSDYREAIATGQLSQKWPRWKCRDRSCDWASWKNEWEEAIAKEKRAQSETSPLAWASTTITRAMMMEREKLSAEVVKLAAQLELMKFMPRLIGQYGAKVSSQLDKAHLARLYAGLRAIAEQKAELAFTSDGVPTCILNGENYFRPEEEEITF